MQSQQDEALQKIEALSRNGGRYRTQAYFFILTALEFTARKLERHDKEGRERHVTGQELSHGIKEYALQEFGPTARLVFTHWGINSTYDFGRIVYDLIGVGLLGKNDEDSMDDFKDVFDMDKEMVVNYRFKLPKKK
ncbi:MAG: hypothetical protein JNL74_19540 [Fibrobacteres bacterium]|nr:hypothetical protein [Fibrobacterota bacterium]